MNYCKWLILRLRIIKHFETLKDYLSEHVDDTILTSYNYLCDEKYAEKNKVGIYYAKFFRKRIEK